ncbi:MAG: isopeptide-forming domain-containing fimbrial protein [Eubacteriales bacterium]|nr:isopeptide-forming domain-containing fimbrial protein [Eubacteriales bacterium]
MKTKKRITERLGAFLLAVLFLAQGILGLLPAREASAAVTSIEQWDENKLVDYQYRFNVKFQPGITTVKTFGCDNQDVEAFTNHGRNGAYVETARMGGNYVPGSAGVRYNNVGRDGDGNIVDFVVRVMGTTQAEPRYDLQTPYLKYHRWKDGWEDDGDGFDWPNGMGQPLVAFSLNTIGVRTYCIGSVKVRFEFLKHGTDEPLAISGHGTVRDLDAGQGVSIPSDSNLDHAYILKGNNFLEVNGTSVQAGNDSLNNDDKRGWLNYLFNTSTINFSFLHQSRLDRWDKEREDGIKKHGSEQNWANVVRRLYADPDGVSYCPEYTGGKLVRGHAYFDFTAYCLGDVEMKKDPEKRVGPVGCDWEDAGAYTREDPFPIQEYEEFQYLIQTELTPNHLSSFVVQDTLKDCLAIDGASRVIVKNDVGDEVTGQFDISVEGQTVTCQAKESYLSKEDFTNNQTYTFILRVHRKEGADVHDFLLEDGYTFLIPNSAAVSYARINGKGETKITGQVWVEGKVIPDLAVEKRASRYEWAVGEEVDYTVKVTQKKPHAWAINTVVEDLTLPSCLKLVDNGYHVEAAPGVEHCVITKVGENGWRVTCPLLQYDESIQVMFRCVATEASNGQEWVNTASAGAENFFDPESGEPKTSKDLAEVWPNTPNLQIDKTADKYEWRVGDEIQYRVVVTNDAPGTIARDVRIFDMGLPEGLRLSGGAAAVEVLDAPQQVAFPVPDHKTGQATEIRGVDTGLNADETGWEFYCSYLPYSHPVTILFHCTATENANGRENVNAASVQAGNAAEKADDAEAYVNTGGFWIEKTADHYEWQLGELVQYQVVVENQAAGTVARNVTIWDTSMPAGLALAAPDAVSISGIPETIADPAAGTPDQPSQINPEWYQETAQKQVGYEFVPEGSGWRLNISDLPSGMPVTIQFQCTVTEEVNGMESINAAAVQAENAPVQTDDAEIYVNTAVLSIEKTVRNPYLEQGDGREPYEFRVGETVEYQVVVNNLQKGSIARNLVISDVSLPEGLRLADGEDALSVSGIPVTILNPVAGTDDMGNQLDPDNYNEVVEKQVEYQLTREGTGWRLNISDLPYQTPVTVVFRCIAQEELNGFEVINTARASAYNGAEVTDTSKVWINTPVLKIEKTADKPTYKYGDIATYRIKVTQEQIGCVARNVTVSDVIETAGVRLLKDSIVLLNENGDMVDAGVEANDNNVFLVHTQRALVKDRGYSIYDGDKGGVFEQVLYNPLDCKAESQMIVEYQAAVIDENLAGKTVHNVAVVNSSEGYPSEDEETVEINSPILDIVKESDQKEYFVGETGYYKLTIRQLREDVTAENIVIEDALDHPGAVIQTDSILIKKNTFPLEGASLEASANGFRIVTGTSLNDADKLEIFYKVIFESPDLDNAVVKNRAWAKGDNTPEEISEHEVLVGDIRPTLVVEKKSDKEVYKPGETGYYQVKITQTEKDAVARNVMLRDILQDSGAILDKKSVKIFDRKGVELDRPEIEATDTGYTIHTGMELAYQEFLLVEYQVQFTETVKNAEILNVAMATADNIHPEEEKIPEPISVGDGLTALKTSDPPSGSIVKENEKITYFITVRNRSEETRKNIMIKDAIPRHVVFEAFGETEGELLTLEDKQYAAFFIDELEAGQEATVSFSVIRQKAEKEDCIVNLAQVRSSIVKREDVTEETWKSPRFFNTNSTIHFADTLWARDENQVQVEVPEPSAMPTPSITPGPSAATEPSTTPTPSMTPEPSVTPKPSTTPEPAKTQCDAKTQHSAETIRIPHSRRDSVSYPSGVPHSYSGNLPEAFPDPHKHAILSILWKQ